MLSVNSLLLNSYLVTTLITRNFRSYAHKIKASHIMYCEASYLFNPAKESMTDTQNSLCSSRVSPGSSLRDFTGWLPGRNSQQNFLRHKLTFLMVPAQVNNPKSTYCLLKENRIIAIYYPLIFLESI